MQSMNNDTWVMTNLVSSSLHWGDVHRGSVHQCRICHVILLTGERPGFCCGRNGSRYHHVRPLPPLPIEYDTFVNHPRISALSRILNLIFSFAALETTHAFPAQTGPPGFVAIQGKVYHRIRPTHRDSAICWLLHDGFLERTPHAHLATLLPPEWIHSVRSALFRVNPFVNAIRQLGQALPDFPAAELIITDTGTTPEIAACMSYENTASQKIHPR